MTALHETASVPVTQAVYATKVVEVALRYVGIRETSRNRGPAIDQVVRAVGLGRSWQLAQRRRGMVLLANDVLSGEIALMRGDQFVRARLGAVRDVAAMRAGRVRPGHTGIVERVGADGLVHTTEANTNDAGSREGDGVYRKTLTLGAPEIVGFLRHRS